ncbi:MAG: sensor diguanylate cyclase, partial [Paucimonas sp.]|nr:sensor diguanylate cyclase [Paucimonas sp.]
MSRAPVRILLSLALIGFGVTVMLGWILRMPLLTRWQPGWVPVVFGTGLCCALAGAALGVMAISRKQGRRVAPVVGSALLGYCALNLFEHLTGARLGIDLAFLHEWLDYGNTRPGLMAPNTSLGFMLVGTQLLLMPAVRSHSQSEAELLRGENAGT